MVSFVAPLRGSLAFGVNTPSLKTSFASTTHTKPVAVADQFSLNRVRFGQTVSLWGSFSKPGQIPKDKDLPLYRGGEKAFINGKLKPWTGSTTWVNSLVLENQNGVFKPKPLGQLPWMGEREAMYALNAAEKAFDKGQGKWPKMSLAERIATMEGFVESMQSQRDTAVKLLMFEIGKSYADSAKEFDRTVEYINDTLEAAREMDATSQQVESVQGILKKERRSPLGVTLCMGPANYPLNETFTTLIPALLMGNTVVCKLPKAGALSLTTLFPAFEKHFPKGTINFISGDGAELVTPMMKSGKVDTLAFIGGTGTSRRVIENHPFKNRLNLVLGLGAKNAGIVIKDADVDQAVKTAVKGALSYNGQRCTALKVMFVHRSIADQFAEKMANAVENLKIGMPYEDRVDITPIAPDIADYMQSLLEDATSKGAKVLNQEGGTRGGTLYKPAVLYPVTPAMRIYTEEQFGPLVPIVPFDDPNEITDYLKSLDLGQQASVFTKNMKRQERFIGDLGNLVSRININEACQRGPDELPFVGRGDSAMGVLSIKEALYRFSLPSLITLGDTPENQAALKETDF